MHFLLYVLIISDGFEYLISNFGYDSYLNLILIKIRPFYLDHVLPLHNKSYRIKTMQRVS